MDEGFNMDGAASQSSTPGIQSQIDNYKIPDEVMFLKSMDSKQIIEFKHFSIQDARECIVMEYAPCK